MINSNIMQNPKRTVGSNSGKSTWYDYYAGYSAQFVCETISNSKLPIGASIMDPWNGSGTTSQIAEEMGYIAYGYDLNPVMIIVAKARRLDHSIKDSLLSVSKDILKKARRYKKSVGDAFDPLETWFNRDTVNRFRNIERGIQQLLINEISGREYLKEINPDKISSLSAFYYVALFRTLRNFLNQYRCTNPTWIKVPRNADNKAEVLIDEIYIFFQKTVIDMTNVLNDNKDQYKFNTNPTGVLKVACSTSIPLPEKEIDMVISSPPYCTRIDYAVSTLPELALMGYSITSDVQKIRSEMIGTTTIGKSILRIEKDWGSTCGEFLDQVRNHQSKASESYYFKNYLQYFDGIHRSLKEIDRTLKDKGKCVLVIQDSYYKDIHIDLVNMYREMGNSLSWILEDKQDFPNKNSMSSINKNVEKYRKPTKAIESVLLFRKL